MQHGPKNLKIPWNECDVRWLCAELLEELFLSLESLKMSLVLLLPRLPRFPSKALRFSRSTPTWVTWVNNNSSLSFLTSSISRERVELILSTSSRISIIAAFVLYSSANWTQKYVNPMQTTVARITEKVSSITETVFSCNFQCHLAPTS